MSAWWTRQSFGVLTVMSAFVLALAGAVRADFPAIVDFEEPDVPYGTTYGNGDTNTVGQVVIVQDDIAVSLRYYVFHTEPIYANFNVATVGGQYDPLFPTTPLEFDNIGLGFDFTAVPFVVTDVSFDYKEFGGGNNIFINGMWFLVEDMTDLPQAVMGSGFQAFVQEDDMVLLQGSLLNPLETLQIGGQELAIDNVTAIPEPATLTLAVLGMAVLLRRRRTKRD